MTFAMYTAAVSLAVVISAVAAYYWLRQYHREALGTRLTGKWNVFIHTFLALVIVAELVHAVLFFVGPVYPYFDFLVMLTVLFAVAFTITLYRLYSTIKFPR